MMMVIAGTLVAVAVILWAGGGNERLRALLRRGGDLPGPDGSSSGSAGSTTGGQTAGSMRAEESDDSEAVAGRVPGRRGRGTRSGPDALAFDLELAAICLGSGLPTAHALALAARAGGSRSGLDRLARAVSLGERVSAGPLAQVAELIEFSGRTGVALAPLLRGLARDLRRSEHRRRQLAAARLGTQLVIPLGVCVLPSFVLLGVVPVLITLLGDFTKIFGG